MNTIPGLYTLKDILARIDGKAYAVGAFTARYTPFIGAILRAAKNRRSPVIIQIAELELSWYQYTLADFVREFQAHLRREFEAGVPTVPICLHLDHTQSVSLIHDAISLGFTSVMIDASAMDLEANIALTREVVEYAHPRGVSVEGELGRIGTTDHLETASDETLYTDPEEGKYFVAQTEVDALAVSVGTSHGQYLVKLPTIDLDRIQRIRKETPAPLVLHGGSGTPIAQIHQAIRLEGGGPAKINIATDLELALLAALGRTTRLTDEELRALPQDQLAKGLQAVQDLVENRMDTFLLSSGRG
jgi:ketose-bisphosphate aldolase